MINLFRFEMFRQRISFGIGTVILALLNIFLYFQLFHFNISNDKMAQYGVLGVLLFFAVFIYLIVESVRIMSRDLLKNEGPFIFMTGHNGYKILGAKLLAVFAEGFSFFLLLGLGSYMYLSKLGVRMAVLPKELLVSSNNLTLFVISVITALLVSWVLLVLTIYLSMAIYKSFLSQQSKGGLISFLIFLVLNFVIKQVIGIITLKMGSFSIMSIFSTGNVNMVFEDAMRLVNYQNIVQIVFAIGLFIGVGALLEKKLEL